MSNKILTNKDEIYGYWKVIEPNVVNPNTTAATYIGRAVFSKCVCTKCNTTIRYIRNNELKKYMEKPCYRCAVNDRLASSRPHIGEKFNKLTVIQDGGNSNARHYSICQCDCGNIVRVKDNSLRSGNTGSCGKCSYSKGEYVIKTLLDQNNIMYNHDILFNELLQETGRRLRFDFIIYNMDGTINRFVEFDGN